MFWSPLQRCFWSVYGRWVWDNQADVRSDALVQKVVAILTACRVSTGQSVLDAGCGTGAYALALAQARFRVTGIDYAAGMLARARAKAPRSRVGAITFHQMSLNEPLVFPDAHFDHIITISVLQVVADPDWTLRELARALKPGGTLLLLHVPRPAYHVLSLREEISIRAAHLDHRTAGKIVLIAVKSWAERAGKTRYWTEAELREMLHANGYTITALASGPPIIITAKKPTNSAS